MIERSWSRLMSLAREKWLDFLEFWLRLRQLDRRDRGPTFFFINPVTFQWQKVQSLFNDKYDFCDLWIFWKIKIEEYNSSHFLMVIGMINPPVISMDFTKSDYVNCKLNQHNKHDEHNTFRENLIWLKRRILHDLLAIKVDYAWSFHELEVDMNNLV